MNQKNKQVTKKKTQPQVVSVQTAGARKISNKRLIFPAIILLITFLAFSPALKNDMLLTWDDQAYVTNNDLVKSLSSQNIIRIFKEDKGLYANWHPLTTLTLAINYKFSGSKSTVYIATNIFIHLLNTLLVFAFIYLLTNKRLAIALVVSLLFGIHPLHVESVAWISERKDVLYSFFFLLSLIAYLYYTKKKNWLMYVVSVVLFFFSLLSKAMAASLPLVLLVTDYYLNRKWSIKNFLDKVPYLAMAIVLGLYAIHIQSSGNAIGRITFPAGLRILHVCYGFMLYIIKTIIPAGLSAFYPYPYPLLNSSWVLNNTPPVLFICFSGTLIVLALAVIIWLRKLSSSRTIIAGLLFYTATAIMVLQFIPVGRAIMADRYAYLPSIGLFLIAGYFFDKYYEKKRTRIIAVALLSLFAGILFFLTWQRTSVWKNDETLWSDVIGKYPNDNRVQIALINRALYYEQIKKYDLALKDNLEVVELNPKDDNTLERIGKIYGKNMNDLTKSLTYLERAYEANPNNLEILKDLGTAYGIAGNAQKSIDYSLKGLAIQPHDAFLLMNAGIGYQNLGDTVKSKEYIDEAVRIDPTLKR